MGNVLQPTLNPYSEELKTLWTERTAEIEDEEVRTLLEQFSGKDFSSANQTSVDITRILLSKTTKFSDLDPFLKMNLFSEPSFLLFKLDDPTFIQYLKQEESDGKLSPIDSLGNYEEQIRKLLVKYAHKS